MDSGERFSSEGTYWSPLETARNIVEGWGDAGDLSTGTEQKWADKNWLNVPGPFYTGETDDGMNGPVYAPGLILCGGEYGMEFIYHQPSSPREVGLLLEAAWGDPMGGYAWDGDERWTPELIRTWWEGRARVSEWIVAERKRCSESSNQLDRDAIPYLRRFAVSLGSDLECYLRGYTFRLLEGRDPEPDEQLPLL